MRGLGYGSWVGVEIPNPPSSNGTGAGEEKEWWTEDGTFKGVRYFEISAEDPDEFRSSSGMMSSSMFSQRGNKRIGGDRDTIRRRRGSVSTAAGAGRRGKGLFVRPQQVLYVVDAVDGDL